jgi:hypothetical protein
MGGRADLAAPHHPPPRRCIDLFGRISWQWRVHRRSNAYAFHDPQHQTARPEAYRSENQPGTQNQVVLGSVHTPARDPSSCLERALARFGAAVAAKQGIEQDAGSPAGLHSHQ